MEGKGFILSEIMLSLSSASLSFSAAPALRPAMPAAAAVQMRQSEALPFLESPPQLDGTLAGDRVSLMGAFNPAVHLPLIWLLR